MARRKVAHRGVKFQKTQEISESLFRTRQSHGIGVPPDSPSVTIHHLPLDVDPSAFYSLRIFDALAPLANPVAVSKRTLCAATNPRFHLIQSPESFCSVFNPVPPDGGQHTT